MKKAIRENTPIYACDFETSVYAGQVNTEVWASGACQLGSHKLLIWNNLDDFMEWALTLKESTVLYFHNLKFDGSFIVSWLLKKGYKHFHGKIADMKMDEFSTSISEMGLWYKINLPVINSHSTVEIRDSLKLLPFSLRKVTKDFGVCHQKLEMEYVGERHAGYQMNEDEQAYFENDLIGLAECLEEVFNRGINSLTIGSECMKEFKKGFERTEYSHLFPDLMQLYTPFMYKGEPESVDHFCREAYRGGWCYVNPKVKGEIQHNGITLDVNSLYPSRMHSEGGCYYPVGKPKAYTDPAFIKCYAEGHQTCKEEYFYIRIKCVFELKEGYLPTIQVHHDTRFNPRTYLTSSGKEEIAMDAHGDISYTNKVVLTLTKTDYYLFMEHYKVKRLEYIGMLVFPAVIGLFDNYLNVWREAKLTAVSKVDRTIAKLFMNNLYGKTAANDNSSYKIPFLGEDGSLKFEMREEHDKTPGYIAVGAAITSYAREFTIRAAQENIEYFCYSDTDSIHLNCQQEDVTGCIIHDKNFNCWKVESIWLRGWFVRAKSYIEETAPDEYDVKCAGMPQSCKDKFASMIRKHNPEWVGCGYEDITAFKPGLVVSGKLVARQVPGGVLLCNTTFKFLDTIR